jgi:hypothetical protein
MMARSFGTGNDEDDDDMAPDDVDKATFGPKAGLTSESDPDLTALAQSVQVSRNRRTRFGKDWAATTGC